MEFNINKRMADVISATESIVLFLERDNAVIFESTSPPSSTVELVKPILEKRDLVAGEDFHLAYSPEYVLLGKILQELVNNARVIGGVDQRSAEAVQEIYASFVEGEIILTDATTA